MVNENGMVMVVDENNDLRGYSGRVVNVNENGLCEIQFWVNRRFKNHKLQSNQLKQIGEYIKTDYGFNGKLFPQYK